MVRSQTKNRMEAAIGPHHLPRLYVSTRTTTARRHRCKAVAGARSLSGRIQGGWRARGALRVGTAGAWARLRLDDNHEHMRPAWCAGQVTLRGEHGGTRVCAARRAAESSIREPRHPCAREQVTVFHERIFERVLTEFLAASGGGGLPPPRGSSSSCACDGLAHRPDRWFDSARGLGSVEWLGLRSSADGTAIGLMSQRGRRAGALI